MSEAKKKPSVALVALAPLVGFYSMAMPYLYWRAAVWLWGPGEGANGATFAAICAQVAAAGAFLVWRAA